MFFNTDYVESRLRSIAEGLPADTRWLLIDANAIPSSTARRRGCSWSSVPTCESGIRLGWQSCTPKPEMLQRAGVIDSLGSDMVFDNLEAAYQAYEARTGTGPRPGPAPAMAAMAIPAS